MEKQKLDIQLDMKALEEAAYDLYEPLFQELNDEPVYLLLNRLRSKGLDWYVEDGIVHLTTRTANENHQYTVSYLLSELIEAGYTPGDELVDALQSTIDAPTWKANGGQGSAIVLGDVLFVRQSSDMHPIRSGSCPEGARLDNLRLPRVIELRAQGSFQQLIAECGWA